MVACIREKSQIGKAGTRNKVQTRVKLLSLRLFWLAIGPTSVKAAAVSGILVSFMPKERDVKCASRVGNDPTDCGLRKGKQDSIHNMSIELTDV